MRNPSGRIDKFDEEDARRTSTSYFLVIFEIPVALMHSYGNYTLYYYKKLIEYIRYIRNRNFIILHLGTRMVRSVPVYRYFFLWFINDIYISRVR